jgi:hypothetical protein
VRLPRREALQEVFMNGRWLPSLSLAALVACSGAVDEDREPGTDAPPGAPGAAPAAQGGGPGTPGPIAAGARGDGAGAGAGARPAGAGSPTLGASALRRLTAPQYRAAIEDLLGAAAAGAVPAAAEPDARLHGLGAIGASVTALSPRATEHYEQAAEAAVAAALDPARRAALVGCDPAQAACLEGFVARLGRRAWRRPLAEAEIRRYVALAQQGATKAGDPWTGLRFALTGLLQSPHFLYRVEIGAADPADPKRRLLGAYELASRLSYFLTNRAPDDALLDAAPGLSRPEVLEAEAKRLLASRHAAPAIEAFYEDYLGTGGLAELTKTTGAGPAFSDAVKEGMRLETVRTLRTLTFDEDLDVRRLFTTRTTFLTADLARFYGLPAPSGPGPVRAELPQDGARAGLLMHGSLLALHAHEGATSPTRRGKFVRETFLCQTVPDPPPGVEATLPKLTGSETTRQRLALHAETPACAACHALVDPIGLALENFDAAGRFRTTENGARVDASGELDGVRFPGPQGLAEAVAAHPRVAGCFATTLLRQAAGDVLGAGSEEALAGELERRFAEGGYRVRPLLLQIVTHPAFRAVRTQEGG